MPTSRPSTAISTGTVLSISCERRPTSRNGSWASNRNPLPAPPKRLLETGHGGCDNGGVRVQYGPAQATVSGRHEPRGVHGQCGHDGWRRGEAWGHRVRDGLPLRVYTA